MGSSTGRRLEVLAVLQSQPGINAAQLAGRLRVTERTARRDVAHLRDLGYRIDAAAGRFGGYTLASGTTMPPLLFDSDEALAVALGLRATVGVGGLGPAAATALVKLTQTVPSRLRGRLQAVAGIESAHRGSSRAADPAALVTLALACRAGEAVRFRHSRSDTDGGRARDAQPHRLVSLAGRWYLVACERGTTDWRTYALDRISDVQPLGTRFAAPPPPADAAALATQSVALAGRHLVRVRLFTSGDLARQLVDPTVASVEDEGDFCIVTLGTDDLDWAARWLVYRDVDFDVIEPTELTGRLLALGRWLVDRYADEHGG